MSSKELPKIYEPHTVEDKWIANSLENGFFKPTSDRKNKNPFTIVIPPPNVTGSLHMGHALNNTLQDVMIRYHRMIGDDTLWVVGTDHAGIATQSVVEKQLDAVHKSRFDLGREKFIERVWQWKEESGGTIINQLKRLGASCDYDNERFTMDEGLTKAVKKVFIDLYHEGLIYRDTRLVNWDPKLHTAISDLEVQQKEQKGNLWYIKYPLENNPNEFITVATTRPETMLGDTAVAVHPDDDRYKKYAGQKVVLPLVNRVIPVILDNYVDPTHGSGAVKITPAHDFNDFEVGKRHQLQQISIFDENAFLNENVPQKYQKLDRFKARDIIIKECEELGLVEKIEPIKHKVPYGDRSGVVVEPYLTEQWFVKAEVLAKPAIDAVKSGQTEFIPKHWEKTYFEWMNHIQPWCISRQIWWGHQIPAWYCLDEKNNCPVIVQEQTPSQCPQCGCKKLEQETDVLDTWFSSALWPFSTLGWPDKTEKLKRYYPTSVLNTAFDIIFFWVARMMMMGLHFMKEVPFKKVYIHALIRDPLGQKMSKSKGNVIDPLQLMEEYGTDALRFTLVSHAAQGRDIKLDEERVKGYRNFCNKIWNASRFALMSAADYIQSEKDFENIQPKMRINQWILFQLNQAIDKTKQGIENFDFNKAASSCYDFFWQCFCDWYIELTKEVYLEGSETEKKEVAATTFYVLDTALKLMHPIMPFITEEIWHMLGSRNGQTIGLQNFPQKKDVSIYTQSSKEIELLTEVVSAIRAVRVETGVPHSEKVVIMVECDLEIKKLYEEIKPMIYRLGKVSELKFISKDADEPCAVTKTSTSLISIPLQGLIDVEKEKNRQEKKLSKLEKDLNVLERQLQNPDFVDKAPVEQVEEKKMLLAHILEQKKIIHKALSSLK